MRSRSSVHSGRPTASKASVIGAVLLLFGTLAAPARALDPPVPPRAVVGPQAKFYGYLTPVVVITKGDALTFSSVDLERHDFVQDVATDGFGGPKKMPWCHMGHHHHGKREPCPVFWSKLIGLNESAEVLGLKNVESGTTYTFFCTLHHGMKGMLIVQ